MWNKNINREYLEQGQILTLLTEKEGKSEVHFQIRSVVNEDGTAVCYDAEKIRDDHRETGKLKEFYPLGATGEPVPHGCHLVRKEDGQLIAEGNVADFINRRDAYPKTTRILWEIMEYPEHELLRNYIQMGEIYHGVGETATLYVWTPGVAGQEMEDYVEEVRRTPEKQPERKLRDVLRIMISLTGCIQALHTAGIMHLDIKPANFIIPYAGNHEINPDHISMFDIDTMYSLQNEVDTRFVGTNGYCAPEVRRGRADNRSDIYSIGAVLFRAIVIRNETDGDGCYRDDDYENIDALVKNSLLITSSVLNSDQHLVEMLANLLKKCLAKDPDKRFERCGELLRELQEILRSAALSGEKRKWLEQQEEGMPETPIQKLLYEHPLYEALPFSPEEREADIPIRVLVAGAGTYGQKFLDLCLQAGQMKGYALSVTVISDHPAEDRESYLSSRPDLSRFVNVDGSMEGNADQAYGSIHFAPIEGEDGETRFFLGTDRENEKKNYALVSEILLRAEECDEGYHYVFVALGDDALNQQVARFFANVSFDLRGKESCPVGYVRKEVNPPLAQEMPDGTYPVCVSKRMTSADVDSQLEQMAFNAHLSWANSLNRDMTDEFRKFREDRYNYNSSLAFALSLKYKLYSTGILLEEGEPLPEKEGSFRVAADPLEAAKAFSEEILVPMKEGDEVATEKFNALVCLEHRRWVLEKVAEGWKAPRDQAGRLKLNECVAKGRVKDEKHLTHPCIVRSTEQTPLKGEAYAANNRAKWEDPHLDPNLDELDRMSVELHQCFRRKADQVRDGRAEYQGELDAIRHLVDVGEEKVMLAYRKFAFCLRNILDGVESYTRQYDSYKRAFLASLEHIPEDVRHSVEERIDVIDQIFFSVNEANLYRDYKQYDETLIRKIPFILSYRSVPGIVMAFEDGKWQNGRNEASFLNVASATVLCPQKITFLYLYEREADPELLTDKISAALNYLRERAMHCEISVAIVCMEDVDKKEKSQLEKQLKESEKEESREDATAALTSCSLVYCADRREAAAYFLEQVRHAEGFLYDGSNELFHSALEDGEFIRCVRETGMPYFEFNWRKKVFTQHIDCDGLQFIEDDSFIRVDDMFSLMKATDNRAELPEFMEEYELLWNIYTGGEGKFEESVRAWNHLCLLLEEYENAREPAVSLEIRESSLLYPTTMKFILPQYTMHAAEKIRKALVECGVADERSAITAQTDRDYRLELLADEALRAEIDKLFWNPVPLIDEDGIQISRNENNLEIGFDRLVVNNIVLDQHEKWNPEEMYHLLEHLQAGGYIKRLKQASNHPWKVSFEYAVPRYKHLLTSAGEILEIYAYYEVLKTGYFDDVATGFEFNWEEGGVKNELDLVLTKGFRSMIVECKAVQKLELNYYHKLHSLADHFGIGTIKVLLGNTYRGNNENINEVNKMQRSRGNQLHIRTIYGKDALEHIGETLKRWMEDAI